jgi:hypothetical protein
LSVPILAWAPDFERLAVVVHVVEPLEQEPEENKVQRQEVLEDLRQWEILYRTFSIYKM